MSIVYCIVSVTSKDIIFLINFSLPQFLITFPLTLLIFSYSLRDVLSCSLYSVFYPTFPYIYFVKKLRIRKHFPYKFSIDLSMIIQSLLLLIPEY